MEKWLFDITEDYGKEIKEEWVLEPRWLGVRIIKKDGEWRLYKAPSNEFEELAGGLIGEPDTLYNLKHYFTALEVMNIKNVYDTSTWALPYPESCSYYARKELQRKNWTRPGAEIPKELLFCLELQRISPWITTSYFIRESKKVLSGSLNKEEYETLIGFLKHSIIPTLLRNEARINDTERLLLIQESADCYGINISEFFKVSVP
jgi:hypothetical protein